MSIADEFGMGRSDTDIDSDVAHRRRRARQVMALSAVWLAFVGLVVAPSVLGLNRPYGRACVAGGDVAPDHWQPMSFAEDPEQAELRAIETEILLAQRGSSGHLTTRLDVRLGRVILIATDPGKVEIPASVPDYAYCVRRSNVVSLDVQRGEPLPP